MAARLLALCFLSLTIGCRPPTPAPSAESNAAAAPDSTGTAVDQAQLATVLSELTQAVRKYSAEQQQVPASLDDLVVKNYLSRVPEAPSGKRFAINKQLQVHLVDR